MGSYGKCLLHIEMNYSGLNGTDMNFTMGDGGAGGIAEIDYIFDRPDIRAIFITLYTIVFCSCFLGKYFSPVIALGSCLVTSVVSMVPPLASAVW